MGGWAPGHSWVAAPGFQRTPHIDDMDQMPLTFQQLEHSTWCWGKDGRPEGGAIFFTQLTALKKKSPYCLILKFFQYISFFGHSILDLEIASEQDNYEDSSGLLRLRGRQERDGTLITFQCSLLQAFQEERTAPETQAQTPWATLGKHLTSPFLMVSLIPWVE